MKDLLKLYSFYSVHGTVGETLICDWLVERLKELGIKDINRDGNTIWHFEKGNRFLLSAHLDQVDTNGQAVHFYKKDDGTIRAYNKFWQRTSLGADDKNGIWCILKCIEKGCTDFDFIISEGEECGCIGISRIEEHIKESTAEVAIVLDRKGNTDILKGGSTDVYCDTLAGTLRNYWNSMGNQYVVTTGTISDTRVICKYIESVNLCVNYEGAHTKSETTDWLALNVTQQNLMRLLTDDFVYYPTKPEVYVKKEYKYSSSSTKDLYDGYGDYDDELWLDKYYGRKKYGKYRY